MGKSVILFLIMGVSVRAQEQPYYYDNTRNVGRPQNYGQEIPVYASFQNPEIRNNPGFYASSPPPSQGQQVAPYTSPTVKPDYHSNCGTCPPGSYRENAPFRRYCGRCLPYNNPDQGSNNWNNNNNCNNCQPYNSCPYPCPTSRRPTYAPPPTYPTRVPTYPTRVPTYPTHTPTCPPPQPCPQVRCPPCPPQRPCPSQYPCPAAVQCPVQQGVCPRTACPPPSGCQYGNCFSNDDPNAGVNDTLIDFLPKKVKIEPKEVKARVGDKVVLRCLVEEDGKVYWEKEGVNDLDKKKVGETGYSLTFKSVTEEDAGTYLCVMAYNNQEEKAEATIIVENGTL